DLLDIPALQRAGLAVAVADAADEVKAVAQLVTRAARGHGGFREVIERILRAQRRWDDVLSTYVRAHRGTACGPGRWGPRRGHMAPTPTSRSPPTGGPPRRRPSTDRGRACRSTSSRATRSGAARARRSRPRTAAPRSSSRSRPG